MIQLVKCGTHIHDLLYQRRRRGRRQKQVRQVRLVGLYLDGGIKALGVHLVKLDRFFFCAWKTVAVKTRCDLVLARTISTGQSLSSRNPRGVLAPDQTI